MKKIMFKTMLTSLLLLVFSFNAQAEKRQCREIGGMGLAEALDDTHLVAALSGAFSGARAAITGKQETATGLILDMEHYFISNKNGLLKTKDKAILVAIPGQPETYMIEINYHVVESRGIYEGYQGEFHSFGLIKLGQGKVVLRYKGEVCK